MNVVITGANRGIGLELARQYLALGATVDATARVPARAEALTGLAAGAAGGALRVHRLDVSDGASVKAFGAALEAVPVDVLVNNAGVFGDADRLTNLDFDEVLATLNTNAVGALRVSLALLPALRRGATRKIASVTSGMGSIADNTSGGHYGYRMSKAALNMAMRSLAVDLKAEGFTAVAINPGWVQTDMGGRGAPTRVEDSARGIIDAITRMGPADSGTFMDYRGKAWAW